MAKRIVTKIGNVFCVEIDNRYKYYFQYICNDYTMMNSSVICVFKTRYTIDYNPILEDIVKDDVMFYAHTVLRAGIEENAWYKVGKTKSVDEKQVREVIWGYCRETLYNDGEIIKVNPLKHWVIWKIGYEFVEIGDIPTVYRNKLEYGSILSYVNIVSRIRLGYYTYASPVYDIIKRIPYPDVDSYTRKEFENIIVWSHFRGEFVVQEIVVKENGETTLSEGNPLDRSKFWQTNWEYKELITKEDFNSVWNKP
ncbi:MAG: immunity 26/phosphotriesterase HocA family protein [Muribaculum sp.]|nr:immunity 26/phosphotriesterase HocA family protein [Muribaculum sp.]